MAGRKLRWRKNRQTISFEDAVWQYFIDHARPTKEEKFFFMMPYLSSKEELLKRIKVREKGLYRYTEEDVKRQKIAIKKKRKRLPWRKNIRKILHWLLKNI